MGGKSWWQWLFPLRFYRSAVVNSPRASGAWYFEWRGRGWHIEAVPVGPADWASDILNRMDVHE